MPRLPLRRVSSPRVSLSVPIPSAFVQIPFIQGFSYRCSLPPHSSAHPGYGCWLSGIDVSTQTINQSWQDPFLAIVVRHPFIPFSSDLSSSSLTSLLLCLHPDRPQPNHLGRKSRHRRLPNLSRRLHPFPNLLLPVHPRRKDRRLRSPRQRVLPAQGLDLQVLARRPTARSALGEVLGQDALDELIGFGGSILLHPSFLGPLFSTEKKSSCGCSRRASSCH